MVSLRNATKHCQVAGASKLCHPLLTVQVGDTYETAERATAKCFCC